MVFALTDEITFPDPHYGDPDGLLAVGGDLSTDRRTCGRAALPCPPTASS